MVASLKREAIDGRPPPGVEPAAQHEKTHQGQDTARIDRLTLLSSFSVWWCMAVLSWWSESSVNFVDDRDLCLLYCVKYDSCLGYRICCSECPFPKLPIPVFIFRTVIFDQVIFTGYRFYSSEFNR